MPSTPTPRLRVETQALGENLNTWGDTRLNDALLRLEEGIAGLATIPIAGTSTTLTSVNYSSDQARNACLVFTGTLTANSTVTVPNVEKLYLAVNMTSGAYSLTLKTAAGAGYALRSGPQWVRCDGTDVLGATPRLDQVPLAAAAVDLNAQKLTNLGAPADAADAATKTYVDAAIAAYTGGTASQYRTGNGTASAPSFSFASDTNTGLRRSAENTLAVVTGGADRVTVGATGDVGFSMTPMTSADHRILSLKGASTGDGWAAVRLEGGVWDKQATFQVGNLNGDVVVGTMPTNTTGGIQFFAGGTPRAYVTPTGELYAGAAALVGGGVPGALTGRHTNGARYALRLDDDGTGFAALASFQNANGQVGSISVSGTTTTYATASDVRLKQDIEPLTGALDRLAQLKPCRFAFRLDPKTRLDGFIAHQVQPICPEAVTGTPDGPGMQAMDAAKLVPLLTAALQELAARVQTLEAGE
jgi:hypothetical protein